MSENKQLEKIQVNKVAPIFILIAGILWGCLGIFVRKLNEMGLYAMDIVSLRAIVTCICMGLFLLLYNRKMFLIKIKDLWCFLGTGLASIVFFNFCYFKAITMTSLSIAAVLLYTAPAIVMILSFFFFKEKFTVRKIISVIMTFIGCALVTGVVADTNTVSVMGILVGLGAGFGYALYSVFSRFAIERGYHSFTITFYTFLFASVGSCFFSNVSEIMQVASSGLFSFLLCLALGILGTVIPYLTYTLGLTYVENGKASIIASIEPVTATVLGLILYQEKLTFTGILGIVIVLGALVICNLSPKN